VAQGSAAYDPFLHGVDLDGGQVPAAAQRLDPDLGCSVDQRPREVQVTDLGANSAAPSSVAQDLADRRIGRVRMPDNNAQAVSGATGREPMSSTSRNFAAILLLLLVAVEFGGGSLLTMLTRRIPGYLDNPLRQNMWRAGHAHPGVWLVLGLVGMLYVDQTPLSAGLKTLVRVTLLVAPILVSLGFFLSVLSPRAERPNGLINLIYLAAILLAIGVVTLGIGLFQA
jgi:hypothetical protein